MTLAAYEPRSLPESLAGLFSLALDLRWSWHHGSDLLWRALDAETWDSTRNAWLVLNSVSDDRMAELALDPEFLRQYEQQIQAHDQFIHAETWYSNDCSESLDEGVAYFCMEYGLSECLPLYSGGLGVLAGDFLKASSDLGCPLLPLACFISKATFARP